MNLELRSIFVIAYSVLFLGLFPSSAKSATLYMVNHVYDGDTITLDNGAKIRLLQIDSPELSSSECYAHEAKQALIKLIGNSKIALQSEKVSNDKDRYGRFLRYVVVGKKNINLELVKIGAAAPYFYNGEKGRYSAQLLKAAEIAKTNKVGLWKICPGTKLHPNSSLTTSISNSTANNPANSATSSNCDPNYQGCIPPSPPDLDCPDLKLLGLTPVKVIGVDVHRLDRDGNGVGCEK